MLQLYFSLQKNGNLCHLLKLMKFKQLYYLYIKIIYIYLQVIQIQKNNKIYKYNFIDIDKNIWENVSFDYHDNINLNFYGVGIIIIGKYLLDNNNESYKIDIYFFDINKNIYFNKNISLYENLFFIENKLDLFNEDIIGNIILIIIIINV